MLLNIWRTDTFSRIRLSRRLSKPINVRPSSLPNYIPCRTNERNDVEYGISARFLSFFTPLATKAQAVAQPAVERATTKLAEVDEKQGLSLKANAGSSNFPLFFFVVVVG